MGVNPKNAWPAYLFLKSATPHECGAVMDPQIIMGLGHLSHHLPREPSSSPVQLQYTLLTTNMASVRASRVFIESVFVVIADFSS